MKIYFETERYIHKKRPIEENSRDQDSTRGTYKLKWYLDLELNVWNLTNDISCHLIPRNNKMLLFTEYYIRRTSEYTMILYAHPWVRTNKYWACVGPMMVGVKISLNAR